MALKLYVDNWRWADVPFYVRTGKRLPARSTEIAIVFKRAPHMLFTGTRVGQVPPNSLVLHLQPDEGISLEFQAKVPGPVLKMDDVRMHFDYSERFGATPVTGYETLVYDCMCGDATLFQRADNVEAGWNVVTPILDVWRALPARDFPNYEAGSWGPAGGRRAAAAGRSRVEGPDMKVLAGDIGGTNTRLAVCEVDDGKVERLVEETTPSADHASLEDIVRSFASRHSVDVSAAGIGLPGPVRGRRAELTNLPWTVDADDLERALGLAPHRLDERPGRQRPRADHAGGDGLRDGSRRQRGPAGQPRTGVGGDGSGSGRDPDDQGPPVSVSDGGRALRLRPRRRSSRGSCCEFLREKIRAARQLRADRVGSGPRERVRVLPRPGGGARASLADGR